MRVYSVDGDCVSSFSSVCSSPVYDKQSQKSYFEQVQYLQ